MVEGLGVTRRVRYSTLTVLLVGLLGGCSANPIESCQFGKRIRELPVSGVIFGAVGTKVKIDSCGGRYFNLYSLGDINPPAIFTRLKEYSEKRSRPVGFKAVVDGYILTDGPNNDFLLVIDMKSVTEGGRAIEEYHP